MRQAAGISGPHCSYELQFRGCPGHEEGPSSQPSRYRRWLHREGIRKDLCSKMTPLDVNTMNHIDGVYAFCAVAATVGMLLLLVRVFKQERAKPSKEFRETKQEF